MSRFSTTTFLGQMQRQPPASPSIDECLGRVGGEACRAAVQLVAARSFRFVPQHEERLADSAVQSGFLFMRDAIHMAGLVSLSAVLEESRRSDLINLRTLLNRLDDAQVRRELAARRGLDSRAVYDQIEQVKRRYEERIRPHIAEVKSIRDEVIAHHGRGDAARTTFGKVFRLAARVIVLVERIHGLANGELSDLRGQILNVRWQSAAIWAKGIDAVWDDQNVVSVDEDADVG